MRQGIVTVYQGLELAKIASERADCSRRQAGVVIITSYGDILSTGANQAPPGIPGCASAGGCPRARSAVDPLSSYDTGPGTCISVHAEAFALMRADWGRLASATMYTTDEPCDGCARLICGSPLAYLVTPTRRSAVPSYRAEVYARLTGQPALD